MRIQKLLVALLCAMLLCAATVAVTEEGISLPSEVDLEIEIESLDDLSLDDALIVDEVLLPSEDEATGDIDVSLAEEGEGDPEGMEAPEPEKRIVELQVTYTGEALSKVYDLNKYAAYKSSATGEIVWLIPEWSTLSKSFKTSLANEGDALVEGHKSVKLTLAGLGQFAEKDVGDYELEFKFKLSGDDAAYYKLKSDVVKVPAKITPRSVEITPRAGVSKTYGGVDPVYPTGSFLSKDETRPLHQDVSGVPYYGVPLNSRDGQAVLTITSANYLEAEAKAANRKMFPGWLEREAGENAGKYRITQGKMDFGKNYQVTVLEEYFEIKPKAINSTDIQITAPGNQLYTGKPIKPDITIKHGAKKLKKGVDYKLKYSNNTKPGTATIKVTGIGNYAGERNITFTIVNTSGGGSWSAMDIADATVSRISDRVYTGKPITPKPVVKYEGIKLKRGTDYTLSYKNNKVYGKATVIIKGKGNYTGSRKVTFKIVPGGTQISKLTGGKKQIQVRWKKVGNITGYQIAYCLKQDFELWDDKIVTNANATSATLKGLKAKTTYYVRIRTYRRANGKTHYSAWSTVKKVKTI